MGSRPPSAINGHDKLHKGHATRASAVNERSLGAGAGVRPGSQHSSSMRYLQAAAWGAECHETWLHCDSSSSRHLKFLKLAGCYVFLLICWVCHINDLPCALGSHLLSGSTEMINSKVTEKASRSCGPGKTSASVHQLSAIIIQAFWSWLDSQSSHSLC